MEFSNKFSEVGVGRGFEELVVVEVEKSWWLWRLRRAGGGGGCEELVVVEDERSWWWWRLRRAFVKWGKQFLVIELLETQFNFWHGHGIPQTRNILRLFISYKIIFFLSL